MFGFQFIQGFEPVEAYGDIFEIQNVTVRRINAAIAFELLARGGF